MRLPKLQLIQLLVFSGLVNLLQPGSVSALDIIPNPDKDSRVTQLDTFGKATMSKYLEVIFQPTWAKIMWIIGAVLGLLAIIGIIQSAIQYMSSGDPKVTETARRRLIQLVIGVALLVATAFIIGLIMGASQDLINPNKSLVLYQLSLSTFS